MIKKTDGQHNGEFSVIDSLFIDKQLAKKEVIEGYQLVKYKDGDFGVLYKRVDIRTNQEQQIAHPYKSIYEKGKEQDVKRTFAYLKKKHLGIAPLQSPQLRPFELRANQKIIAKIENITKDLKNGIAELKLAAGKKKLIMRIKNDYAQNLKAGARIAIVQRGEGIKINVLGIQKNRALKR